MSFMRVISLVRLGRRVVSIAFVRVKTVVRGSLLFGRVGKFTAAAAAAAGLTKIVGSLACTKNGALSVSTRCNM